MMRCYNCGEKLNGKKQLKLHGLEKNQEGRSFHNSGRGWEREAGGSDVSDCFGDVINSFVHILFDVYMGTHHISRRIKPLLLNLVIF